MNAFNYRDGELFAEGVALSAIAERYGTPKSHINPPNLGRIGDIYIYSIKGCNSSGFCRLL